MVRLGPTTRFAAALRAGCHRIPTTRIPSALPTAAQPAPMDPHCSFESYDGARNYHELVRPHGDGPAAGQGRRRVRRCPPREKRVVHPGRAEPHTSSADEEYREGASERAAEIEAGMRPVNLDEASGRTNLSEDTWLLQQFSRCGPERLCRGETSGGAGRC